MKDPSSADLGFVHRFIPAHDAASACTLLLLHGTGGDESDLIPLGRALAPGAALLSPRGKVLENGSPRFFRRLGEGVFDLEDLVFRARELTVFAESAARVYGFDRQRLVAAGYSNGANMAGALLLLHPGLLAGAVLFHPMVPLTPPVLPDLSRMQVFIGAGRGDPIVAAAETERLASLLRQAGADVAVHWRSGGHALASGEVQAAREWLSAWT